MTTQDTLPMCPNSISHSPSGSVLTSPSSWKEVGNPQCWQGPGWPLWAMGDQFCQEGVCGYRQRSCVVSASLAHDTEPHHRPGSHLLQALCTSLEEEQWEGSATVLHQSLLSPCSQRTGFALWGVQSALGDVSTPCTPKLYTLTCMWRIANGVSFLPSVLWLALISKGRLSSGMVKSPGLHTP